jgi:hypothetical protein
VVTKFVIDGQVADLNAPPLVAAAGVEDSNRRLLRPTAMTRRTPESSWRRRSTEVACEARNRLENKAPGGPNGSGHRMTQRWADTLFQPTQWYPRVAVYDDLRGWGREPLPRPVRVLQFRPFT